MSRLVGTFEAARVLGVSVTAVHNISDRGDLPVEMRVAGRRLFKASAVEKLARKRAEGVRS